MKARAMRTYFPRKIVTSTNVAVAAGLVVAVGLGIGWGSAAGTANDRSHMMSSLKTELSKTTSTLDKYKANAAASDAAKTAAEEKERDLDQKLAAAAATQAELDAAKQQVVASQMTDGVHVVGTNLAPGVYSISTSTDCYYVWKSGTGSDASIIDNNIVSGPATVTLKAGDVFETNRCGTWNKVG